MRGRWMLLAVLCAAGLAGLAFLASRGLEPTELAAWLRDTDPWGPLLFVTGLALVNGLGMPAVLFVLTAIAVWPPLEAFLWLWTGALGAGVVGYFFARTLGRSFVQPRLPTMLRDLDDRVARNALRTVILVRCSLYLLGPSHWALGLSSVRPAPMLLGSLIGFVPGSALWAFGGGEFLQAMSDGSGRGWIALGVILVLAFLVPRWVAKRRGATTARRAQPSSDTR